MNDEHRSYLPDSENPVCDFCSSPEVRWRYPARSHKSGTLIALGGNKPDMILDFNSDGDWAACPRCHSLIQSGNRDGLARYSVKKLKRPDGSLPMGLSFSATVKMIRGVHDNFWKNREGSPDPVEVQQ